MADNNDKNFKALIAEQKKTTAALQSLKGTNQQSKQSRERSDAELKADESRREKALLRHQAKIEKGGKVGTPDGTGAPPTSEKEDKKDEDSRAKASNSILSKGFKNLTGAFGKLSGIFKSKFGGAITTLGSLLKFGLLGAALFALSKFLQSETWAEWKKTLVPNLVKAFDFVTGAIKSIKDKIVNGITAFKTLWGGFFDEEGNFVGIMGAWDNLVENAGCILPAIAGLSLAFAGIAATLAVAGLGIIPRLIFGGLYKGGKWLIGGGIKIAFKTLAGLLGLGKSVAGFAVKGFWSGTTKVVSGIFTGIKNRFTSLATSVKGLAPKFLTNTTSIIGGMFTGIKNRLANLADDALKIAAPVVKKGAQVVTKSIAATMGSKVVRGAAAATSGFARGSTNVLKSGAGALASKGKDLFKKFPNLLKATKILGKVPIIGPVITGALLMNILRKGGSKEEMADKIGGLFGSVGGAILGGSIAGLLGLSGGPLALITGLVGTVGGALAGDGLGRAMGQFIVGKQPIDAFGWPFNFVDNALNSVLGTGGSAMAADGGGGTITPVPTKDLGTTTPSVGTLPKSNGNGGGGINYFPAEGGGSTPVPNTIINAPMASNQVTTNNQNILKTVVEPDPYFLRQSAWAI